MIQTLDFGKFSGIIGLGALLGFRISDYLDQDVSGYSGRPSFGFSDQGSEDIQVFEDTWKTGNFHSLFLPGEEDSNLGRFVLMGLSLG